MFTTPESITVANAATALQAGLTAIANGVSQFDLAALRSVDSAAVATLLAWQRAARSKRQTLEFVNLPENLTSLMHLYGVADILLLSSGVVARNTAVSGTQAAEFGRH